MCGDGDIEQTCTSGVGGHIRIIKLSHIGGIISELPRFQMGPKWNHMYPYKRQAKEDSTTHRGGDTKVEQRKMLVLKTRVTLT